MRLQQHFEWKPFLKETAVLAIPVALQNLLATTGSMVDTMMIGSLGPNTVGAVGLCAQFSSLMLNCYWGFVGVSILFFSQYWGAKDDDGIDRSYGLTWVCMMSVAVIFALLALLFPREVMSIYTDKSSIQLIGAKYFRVIAFAYPLQVFSMVTSCVLRSTENAKIPLEASIIGVFSNVFLNWVLIYGHLGMPAMGVEGAALATVCASAINLIMVFVLARAKKFPYLFHLRRHFRWKADKTKEYFRKAAPIIANELAFGFGNMIINMVLGRQSEEAIAAIAVFRVLEGLIISFFTGFSSASSVLVGKHVGAGHPESAYERAKRLVYLCGGSIVCVCLAILALNGPILKAMSLSGESYRICFGMFAIYCGVAVLRMMNWIQNDTYRAAGDAVFGTILEIVTMYTMLIPMACLSGLVWKWPVLIVFALCFCDEPLRFILMQVHMYSGKWIRPVTPQGIAAMEHFREHMGIKPPKPRKAKG